MLCQCGTLQTTHEMHSAGSRHRAGNVTIIARYWLRVECIARKSERYLIRYQPLRPRLGITD